MFYEGTEKRLFICTKDLNLLTFEQSFWHDLVSYAGAEIISSINNTQLTAFLLSESSLFIWEDKLLLITCGNTQLVKAALFIQQQLSKEKIKTLIFQRHQALKPQLQPTNFQQDRILLEKQFNGQQLHWREDYQGDLFVFGEISTQTISTQGIYMLHGLRGEFAENLQSQHIDKTSILKKLRLSEFFNDFMIDHFSFKPKGYSLNAISQQDYLTIHLTPEKLSTYLSIETSLSETQSAPFIAYLVTLFLPLSLKRVHFQSDNKQLKLITC
ncbi:S-adenosylmethionine decarboxylase [Psychromonas sp.]|uniref:S-adenosylmethionine decarboxylase n=1 Tax=Psychromonas sp. TaxID=1884585 RepID=UPI003A971B14